MKQLFIIFLPQEKIISVADLEKDENSNQQAISLIKDVEKKYLDKDEREKIKKELKDRKIKDNALEFLREAGVVEKRGNVLVWDFVALKNMTFEKRNTRSLGYRNGRNIFVTRFNLFDILKDEKGISKEDYDQASDKNELKPRKIFYYPDNIDDAFDLQKIKQDDSYFDFTEIGKSFRRSDWNNLVELPDGNKISLVELYLSRKIFKDFDAKRNQDEELIVNDNDEELKFNAQWFRLKTGFHGGSSNSGEISWNMPIAFLQSRCPNLLSRGLLKESDFASKRHGSGSFFRNERSIQPNGLVYINGTKYTLSYNSQPDKKDNIFNLRSHPESKGVFKVVELSPDLAGVIKQKSDGLWHVDFIFPLKSKEDIEAKKEQVEEQWKEKGINKKVISGDVCFSAVETNLQPYTPVENNKNFSNENNNEYASRIYKLVSNFDFIQKLSTALSRQAGIAIHDQLSWREQQWLATAANETPDGLNQVVEGAKKYGIDFLRTFLSAEYGVENSQVVLRIVKEKESKIAEKVFSKYSEIAIQVDDIENYLTENFGEANENDINLIRENLLRQAKNLLVDFSKKEISAEGALNVLNDIKVGQILFNNSFRALASRGEIDLEKIKNISLEVSPAQWLDDQTKDDLLDLNKKNRQGYPEKLLTDVQNDLERSLNSPDSKFYILNHQQEGLLGFMRIDKKDDGSVYAGSLNIIDEAKGSKIGTELFREVLRKETKSSPVWAAAKPDKKVTRTYLRELGFRIKEVDDNYHDTGEEYLIIECNNPDQKNNADPEKQIAEALKLSRLKKDFDLAS